MLPYEDIAKALTARHIATPIEDLAGCSDDDDPLSVGTRLRDSNFDWGAVLNDRRIVGRVASLNLGLDGRSITEAMEPLAASYLASANSPIGDVMHWLKDDPWLLVVDANEISGLVTPADLNRQPARAHFYLLLSDLEMRLAASVRRTFADQSEVLSLLEEGQKGRVEGRHRRMTQSDTDVDLVAAMDFSHLVSICHLSSALEWTDLGDDIVELRNQTMHSARGLLTEEFSLARLLDVESRLRKLLSRPAFPSDNRV